MGSLSLKASRCWTQISSQHRLYRLVLARSMFLQTVLYTWIACTHQIGRRMCELALQTGACERVGVIIKKGTATALYCKKFLALCCSQWLCPAALCLQLRAWTCQSCSCRSFTFERL